MRSMRWIVLLLLMRAIPTPGADLVYAAGTDTGEVLVSKSPDRSFNPASVVKVGTSLMALERLGEDYRYVTEFSCTGPCTISDGRLSGDLVVTGGGDPDFQAENAWMVAEELSKLGIHSISGDLCIRGRFWIGWEHGIRKSEKNPSRRAELMGGRLRKAWDSRHWNHTLTATWEDAALRRGWESGKKFDILVEGKTVLEAKPAGRDARLLVRHRSNPLPIILKRFNTYSNNDIIRIAEPLGGARALEAFLRALCADLPGKIRISSASGEGVNRMTAKQVLRLLSAFETICDRRHLRLQDLLPVPGCDPGPTGRMFPRLAGGEASRSAVIKTGTLSNTDGGIAVLSGFIESRKKGRILFCIAAPDSGSSLKRSRRKEESWLLNLEKQFGGTSVWECGGEFPLSDSSAVIEAGPERSRGAETTGLKTSSTDTSEKGDEDA